MDLRLGATCGVQSEIESLQQQLAKVRVDGDAVAGQLRQRVAALEAEIKAAVAAGHSDAAAAAANVGGGGAAGAVCTHQDTAARDACGAAALGICTQRAQTLTGTSWGIRISLR